MLLAARTDVRGNVAFLTVSFQNLLWLFTSFQLMDGTSWGFYNASSRHTENNEVINLESCVVVQCLFANLQYLLSSV